MTAENTFILGTRGSLLALTQSQQVARELETKAGIKVKIKTITTQGDLNTSVPLWQMDGKDFFTKELDHALIAGEIDFVVHSYKDLGSDRPEGIKIGAISERVIANDILFASRESIENLKEKDSFVVGTSSPRRIYNIEKNLSHFLPHSPKVECKNLRGNVNTRLSKIQTPDYDAVVLAFAGLERLAKDQDASRELETLIQDCDFMVLPASEFPPAASQGALAVEYCDKNPRKEQLVQALQTIHSQKTKKLTDLEREKFKNYGGGCHLAVGIHADQEKDAIVFFERGHVDNIEIENQTLFSLSHSKNYKKNESSPYIFLGLPSRAAPLWAEVPNLIHDNYIQKTAIQSSSSQEAHGDILVSTSYALDFLKKSTYQGHLWVSGSRTWKKLAKEGYWINGSCDSLGEGKVDKYRKSHLISLKKEQKKTSPLSLFTNAESSSQIEDARITSTYSRKKQQVSDEEKERIEKCTIFFWTSFFQYKSYTETFNLSKDAFHCCGLGKTYQEFQKQQIEVTPFLSMKEFKKWILSLSE